MCALPMTAAIEDTENIGIYFSPLLVESCLKKKNHQVQEVFDGG